MTKSSQSKIKKFNVVCKKRYFNQHSLVQAPFNPLNIYKAFIAGDFEENWFDRHVIIVFQTKSGKWPIHKAMKSHNASLLWDHPGQFTAFNDFWFEADDDRADDRFEDYFVITKELKR